MLKRYLHDRNTTHCEGTNDKDRIEGSVEQAKDKVKEVAGKVVGDSKLKTEDKVQNVVGGFKAAVKDAINN